FAMDRADAKGDIEHLATTHSVVILDRYVASNAAYSAARLGQGAHGDVVGWVADLEYGRLRLPTPDWQLLLDVPTDLAAQRAVDRAAADSTRRRDAYERDDGLQRRTSAVYAELAAANWGGRWAVVDPDVDAGDLAAGLQ
ncbi:MAG: dTMP kinase, partial [Mycobacterium sp.]|nr:dTMP kinase [Mycobacterium sp.]